MTVRKGLVLEGGAMRGMFTNGVTDVMMENGITYDGLVGVSAGAAFGCNYKSNQPGRAIRYNTDYCNDPRYCSFRSLIKTGDIYGAEFCYEIIPDTLDIFDWDTFVKNPMEFHVVCTDVDTGKAVYKQCDEREGCFDWIRASASMPVVSQMVEIEGRKYLDGLRSDVARLGGLAAPELNMDTLKSIVGKLEEEELLVLRSYYADQVNRVLPMAVQLPAHKQNSKTEGRDMAFLI